MSFEFQNRDIGKTLGREFVEGLGVGINDSSYQAITVMENVYVELENLTKNAAKNAERLEKERQARQLQNLKNALKLQEITKQEYYEKLKTFRDTYLREGTDNWYKCTEEIALYNRELFDELIKLRDKLAKEIRSQQPWVESSKVRFVGMGEDGRDLVYNDSELGDFREEIQLLEEYRDRLLELRNLGNVPEGVFKDIGKMDVKEGLETANIILNSLPQDREAFFAGYREYENVINSSSQDLLGVLKRDELKDAGINPDIEFGNGLSQSEDNLKFAQILEDKFEEVPESYFSIGEKSGDAFGEGFLSKVPEIMESTRTYFAELVNELAQQIAAVIQYVPQEGASSVTNTYKNTYNFNSSRDTTTQQLSAARNASMLEQLRGGNS